MRLSNVIIGVAIVSFIGIVVANFNVIDSLLECEGTRVSYSMHSISAKNSGVYQASSYVIEGNCVRFSTFMGEQVICGNYNIRSYTLHRCEK